MDDSQNFKNSETCGENGSNEVFKESENVDFCDDYDYVKCDDDDNVEEWCGWVRP